VKKLVLLAILLVLPTSSLGQVRIMFSHQSVGRNVVGDPERANPDARATSPIRDFLDGSVAFWDHDYYNFSRNGVTNAILDPDGNNWAVASGFGPHRGSDGTDVLMDHLIGGAFSESATGDARAFRDSCMSRFDIVMIKAGYRDMHMNTASSLANYQSMLNDASDWWHNYNIEHETQKYFVVMTASSLRHPSDYSQGSASWPDTPEGHAEAEADAAAYRALDRWLENTWAHRNPENRYFSTWWLCVNQTGPANERYFTKDIYTGTGAGDSSGDHHLNTVGSNTLQAALVEYIYKLVGEFNGNVSTLSELPDQNFTLFNATPNPFNPTTALSFTIADPSRVRLSIYEMSGSLVNTLVNEKLDAGRHQIHWNGRDNHGARVASGVYLYRIETGTGQETKRMVMVK